MYLHKTLKYQVNIYIITNVHNLGISMIEINIKDLKIEEVLFVGKNDLTL